VLHQGDEPLVVPGWEVLPAMLPAAAEFLQLCLLVQRFRRATQDRFQA
jgi:hypothetical protein